MTNLVPRSQSVRQCRNVRSGKVRYKAISGWLPELRMPHSNLGSVKGSFLLCLVLAQFGEETKARKSGRAEEDCHATI